MLSAHPTIRYRIATILAAHWGQFVARHERWIRPAVFENVSKVLHCRTAAPGCHLYRCPGCGLQLQLVGVFFGSWSRLEQIFRLAGSDGTVPTVRLSPG